MRFGTGSEWHGLAGPWVARAEAARDRPQCADCGEPVVLETARDPESWIHAPDARDDGHHTAWIAGEGISSMRPCCQIVSDHAGYIVNI